MRPFSYLAMAILALCAGCASPQHEPPGSTAAATDPFHPVSLRIHPLTHIDAAARAKDGSVPDKSSIVLHFELKDRYGDSVKALGTLNVQLSRPGAGITPGMESRELEWSVPELADPEENIRRFDPPTRTYRIVLSGPRWITEWAARPADQRKDGPSWLRLRAVMELVGENGKVLEDEYVIQG